MPHFEVTFTAIIEIEADDALEAKRWTDTLLPAGCDVVEITCEEVKEASDARA